MPTVQRGVKGAIDLKDACVHAAREVIAERGIEHLSLREVSRKLGVSHQAPYKHYPSRDHLLAEVMRRCFLSFTEALDTSERHEDPVADLESLSRQYLAYAAAHPLEYRLMFNTPWPERADHPELARDALHVFNVLRDVLQRIYGEDPEARAQVELHAVFIWSSVHGLASISQFCAMGHLQLAANLNGSHTVRHAIKMVEKALRAG
jgi:AcrR family transcriptional regulator